MKDRTPLSRARECASPAGPLLLLLILVGGFSLVKGLPAQDRAGQGLYFSQGSQAGRRIPSFEEARAQLPNPIYEGKRHWIELYWKAWELAFRNFYEPTPASGFVSRFVDAAFSENIFLWDTCFITMFCNVAHPLVPGIESLDNFYVKQHQDGEICREINRETGQDLKQWVNSERREFFSRWGWMGFGKKMRPLEPNQPVEYVGRTPPEPIARLTLDALNHPILAWAELESYRVTGDRDRLQEVWLPLVKYYGSLDEYLRQGNGLYMTDWASMDNSSRNPYLRGGGTAVDTSSEMVLFARCLGEIGRILGKSGEGERYEKQAQEIAQRINRLMWNEEKGFYFDLELGGRQSPVKTIAGFWPLVARVADRQQVRALVGQLRDPKTFGLAHRVPSMAANEPGYQAGAYWRGAVWAPTNTMVIRGLQACDEEELAREIALEHLNAVADVYRQTGTIWEDYSAESIAPGRPARKDFVGWSGLGPILYLLEFGIGLKPDASRNLLVWTLNEGVRHGCERFRFNGHLVSLIAAPASNSPGAVRVSVRSSGPFDLILRRGAREKRCHVHKGSQQVLF